MALELQRPKFGPGDVIELKLSVPENKRRVMSFKVGGRGGVQGACAAGGPQGRRRRRTARAEGSARAAQDARPLLRFGRREGQPRLPCPAALLPCCPAAQLLLLPNSAAAHPLSQGICIAKRNRSVRTSFTLRNIFGGAGGVERTFPL